MTIRNFRELRVWRVGMEVLVAVYELTRKLPREEMYGLTSQLRRAAVSVPSNISEGFNRRRVGEYVQHLHYALGSCAELDTQIEACKLLEYVTEEEAEEVIEQLTGESKMLRRLSATLEKQTRSR